MAQTSFYSEEELATIGLKSYGHGVFISRYARLYSPECITIGDNVRVDDFCVLSGNISLGSNIHIAPFCALYGNSGGGVLLRDFSGLSARVTIYAAIDDFSGEYAVGSMAPIDKRRLISGSVILEKYVQIGAGTCIFPNVVIGEGTAVGAMSLVKTSLPEWGIYAGIPVRKLKDRKKRLVELLKE